MRSKKNDIRVSRKMGPVSVPSSNAQSSRSRSLRKSYASSVASESVETDHLSAGISVDIKPHSRSKVPKIAAQSAKPNKVTSSKHRGELQNGVKDAGAELPKSSPSLIESKRKRSGAESYIKKRFLYDVVEPPKRTRQKKFMHLSDRSTAALMAVSSANLLKKHKTKLITSDNTNDDPDLLAYFRSRRGRRLKPKHEYSPSHNPTSDSISDGINTYSDFEVRRPHKRTKLPSKSTTLRSRFRPTHSVWHKEDTVDENSYYSNFKRFSDLAEIADLDSTKNYVDTVDLPDYSDVLRELQASPRISRRIDSKIQKEIPRRSDSRFKGRSTLRRVLSPSIDPKGSSDTFLRQSLFATDGASIGDSANPTDLLDFCTGSHSDHFEHLDTPGEIAGQEDDGDSTESRSLHTRRVQPSNEELEEDLLAPELSILAGTTAVTTSDGLLVSNLGDGSSILSGGPISGSSRRKSPVRPMQVLRTKSTHASSTVSTQPSMLGTGVDGTPYVFTSSPVVSNNIVFTHTMSETELANEADILSPEVRISTHQQPVSESGQLFDEGAAKETRLTLQPTSIVRVTNLVTTDVNQMNLRSHLTSSGSLNSTPQISISVDGSATTTAAVTASSGLLPSLLSQNPPRPIVPQQHQSVLSRVFVTNGTVRPVATIPNKTIISVSHTASHVSSSNRRRPTILRRVTGGSIGTNSLGVSLISQRQSTFDAPENESDLSAYPTVPRSIGLFNPTSGHIRKTVGPTLSDAEVGAATPPVSAPTRLLQLVTTSSLPTSQSSVNQTASDRLFGKRPLSYTKSTIPPVTTSMVQHTAGSSDFKPLSTVSSLNNANPYRYAVVRGSADGKQYVLISSPRVVDQQIQEPIPMTTSLITNTNESITYVPNSSALDENFESTSMYPIDTCIPGAFKVEINGAQLLRTQTDIRGITNTTDRQIRAIFTANPGTTTMAAT